MVHRKRDQEALQVVPEVDYFIEVPEVKENPIKIETFWDYVKYSFELAFLEETE